MFVVFDKLRRALALISCFLSRERNLPITVCPAQGPARVPTSRPQNTFAMSGKTLSTGTLSLRFMQNAHRAKQLAEVEAEQAQVKDEAEWEVAKEVREAWGIGSGSSMAG